MGKFYITTSIPYANAEPHIGNILDSLIADVLARYHRMRGDEVRFLVGTDEHGAKIARTALLLGLMPQELVDKNSARFHGLREILNLSWDDFIRTSDKKRHWPGAEKMWLELVKAGDIYLKKYRGLYCVGHEAFITEKDLMDGKCSDHAKEPEAIEEENWFFRLSRYAEKIKNAIESDTMQVLPSTRKNEILALIESGLEDVSFSRPSKDLSWGVPVPQDQTQTMYVWGDALVNYISSIGYGHADAESHNMFKKWWPADVQVIGKDNLRFHAAIWPGMLLAANLDLPKVIFVHGFITINDKKISKTVGNVIAPNELVEKYGTDPVRHYFLSEFPSHADGDFSFAKFEERYQGELANGLGNLVSRLTSMIERFFGGALLKPDDAMLYAVPFKRRVKDALNSNTLSLEAEGVGIYIERKVWPLYRRALDMFNIHEANEAIWTLLRLLDGYIQNYEPFKLVKSDEQKARAVLWNASLGLLNAAHMLSPFMPKTAEKIFSIFGIDPVSSREWREFRITKSEALFPRLDK